MDIDLMEIGNMKDKKTIEKFGVNKQLLNGNYLFHYMILTNNINGLMSTWHPIYNTNNDGYDGIMLAAKEHKYDILNYFLKKYKKQAYKKNTFNSNWLHIFDPNNPKYVDILKNNLHWDNLFTMRNNNEISPLDNLFTFGIFENILYVIQNIKINYNDYKSKPAFFNIFYNNHIESHQFVIIIKELYKKNKTIIDMVDNMGYTVIFGALVNNNIDLVHFIVNIKGTDLDTYSPISGNHIFIIAYKTSIGTNDYTVPQYIYKHVMKHHDFNETDSNGDTIGHFILKTRMNTKKGNFKLEKHILKRFTHWTKINKYKVSPFDLIVNLSFSKYHKFLKSRPSTFPYKLEKHWQKYVMSLPIHTEQNNINIIDAPFAHTNLFQATFLDMAIFSMYLKDKYNDDIYLPIYNGKIKLEWEDDIELPTNLLYNYNNFPWFIVWNNATHYWVHPHLNKIILNNKSKYKCAFVVLSITLPEGGLHAGLVFYDFTRNMIERFDPYGNTTILDGEMDKILGRILTKGLNMSYCSPSCDFPVSGFQTLSDETNEYNQKPGDFGGYCLAWSIWYCEHKLNNIQIDSKDLVRKTINRFMQMQTTPMEYIRNYANHINKYRIDYMIKQGIPLNIVSNEHLNYKYINQLFKSIIKYHKGV